MKNESKLRHIKRQDTPIIRLLACYTEHRKLLTTLITRGAVRTIKQRQIHNNKIHELLKHKTDVFFARSYASYKRDTKENHHKLIRRFIPKNKRLDEISTQTINRIQQ